MKFIFATLATLIATGAAVPGMSSELGIDIREENGKLVVREAVSNLLFVKACTLLTFSSLFLTPLVSSPDIPSPSAVSVLARAVAAPSAMEVATKNLLLVCITSYHFHHSIPPIVAIY